MGGAAVHRRRGSSTVLRDLGAQVRKRAARHGVCVHTAPDRRPDVLQAKIVSVNLRGRDGTTDCDASTPFRAPRHAHPRKLTAQNGMMCIGQSGHRTLSAPGFDPTCHRDSVFTGRACRDTKSEAGDDGGKWWAVACTPTDVFPVILNRHAVYGCTPRPLDASLSVLLVGRATLSWSCTTCTRHWRAKTSWS